MFLFVVILILLASYFSPVKEIAPNQDQERQRTIAKGITEKDLSFDQLPSIESVSESSPTTDFLYTKEYQLSRLENNYELTYSLTKGLVGVGYKGSVKLDQLVPKLFGSKQVQELESKGYTKEETTKTGYHYFAHPKFQLN